MGHKADQSCDTSRRVRNASRHGLSDLLGIGLENDASAGLASAEAGNGSPPSVTGSGAPTVPGYRILRELQRGGQAVVYQALQESTGRKVALKILRSGPLAHKHERARLMREVQALAALRHPNIVNVVDCGTTKDGWQYLVTDYIPGLPLTMHVRQMMSDAPLNEILGLFIKCCKAVHAAHLRGIVHRDLKPNNILVDASGEPHLLDFGLACGGFSTDRADGPITTTGEFLGSLPYASPEQANGRASSIDIRTDVYSLGIILYELITGRFPYRVTGPHLEVLQNIIKADVLPPSRFGALSSSREGLRKHHDDLDLIGLDPIVLKALAKDCTRRYQSAGELASDLEAYVTGARIPLQPAAVSSRIKVSPLVATCAVILIALAIALLSWPTPSSLAEVPAEAGSETPGTQVDIPAPSPPIAPATTSPASTTSSASVEDDCLVAPATLPAQAVRPPPAPDEPKLATIVVSQPQGIPLPRRSPAFVRHVLATRGHRPVGIIATDFTKDAVIDLAVLTLPIAADTPASILIFAGDSKGSFKRIGDFTGVDVNTPQAVPASLIPGDLNGDGAADLLVTYGRPGDLSSQKLIFMNKGNGQFDKPIRCESFTYTGATLVDVNDDTLLDLVGITSGGSMVQIRERDGSLRFPMLLEAGHFGYALADFDGDKRLDFLGTSGSGLRLNSGLDTNVATSISHYQSFGAIVTADFDSDGRPDAGVAGSPDDWSVRIFMNHGNLKSYPPLFREGEPRPVGIAPLNLAVADVDGDHQLDLVAFNQSLDGPDAYRPGRVSVLLGDGDGTFDFPTCFATEVLADYGQPLPGPSGPSYRTWWRTCLATADFNGDGRDDLATADVVRESVTLLIGETPQARR